MITSTFFKKTRFRSISLMISAAIFATSCQKHETLNPTQQELDTIHAHQFDYALQVIPNIHDVMPLELIKAMDSVPVCKKINGHDTVLYISALHFGDNPPNLYKIVDDTLWGFAAESVKVSSYYQYDSTSQYVLDTGLIRPYTNYFRFYDQHRGVSKFDFRCSYIDFGENNYIFETAHVTDSVFIMGHDNYFTAYFRQKRTKEYSRNYNPDDPGEKEAVILSGEVTATGIRNLYFAMNITGYVNPADAGTVYPNINDIVIFYKKEVPFTYWDPFAYTDNN